MPATAVYYSDSLSDVTLDGDGDSYNEGVTSTAVDFAPDGSKIEIL